MQVRNIVDVEALGLPPGMIGTQEPKSGYHYGDCASTATPVISPGVMKNGISYPPYILYPFCAPPSYAQSLHKMAVSESLHHPHDVGTHGVVNYFSV